MIVFYYLKTFFYPAALGIDQQWTVMSIDLLIFLFLNDGFIIFLINMFIRRLYLQKQ